MTGSNYSARLCACGNSLLQHPHGGRPRKYCGPDCVGRPRAPKQATRLKATPACRRLGAGTFECIQCGSAFEAKHKTLYCCSRCKDRAKTVKRNPAAKCMGPKTRIEPRCCKGCGELFKPTSARYGTYCSRECSFAAKAATPSCKVWTGYCLGCGHAIASRRERAYCSEGCRPGPELVRVVPSSRECKCCGVSFVPAFTGGCLSVYCGDRCRDLVEAAVKRADKAKRKAVLRGAAVETVDPFRVFDRDKWRCQICSIKTPKRKRGTYDDDAPELDHIVPLAKGGAHSYLNTQCACRKCNREKSDTPRGQMLLIG